MNTIQATFDDSFAPEERLAVERLLADASPALNRLLGPAVAGTWTLRKGSRPDHDSETNFAARELFLHDALKPSEVLHEVAHAWHALDLRYSLLEEGIALAAAFLACEEIGVADALGATVEMSDRTRNALGCHPAGSVDRFLPLNAPRYAALREAWTNAARRASGSLAAYVEAFRALDRETAFIEAYGDALRAVDAKTYAELSAPIAAEAEWRRLLKEHARPIPYLAACVFSDLRRLRVVTGAKVPGTLQDRTREQLFADDAAYEADGTCTFVSEGKTVASVPFQTKDGAANLLLDAFPAGSYTAKIVLRHPPLTEVVAFHLR